MRGIEPLDRDELRSQGRQRRPTFSTMGITFTVCADGRGPRPGVAARRHPSIQSERRERLADHALHGVAPQLEQDRLQTQALHQPLPRRPSGGVPDRRVSVALPGVEARLLLHSTSVVSSESCRRSAEFGSRGVEGGLGGQARRQSRRRLAGWRRRRPSSAGHQGMRRLRERPVSAVRSRGPRTVLDDDVAPLCPRGELITARSGQGRFERIRAAISSSSLVDIWRKPLVLAISARSCWSWYGTPGGSGARCQCTCALPLSLPRLRM